VKKALVTIAIGNRPHTKWIFPPFEVACKRHGWAFEVITDRKIKHKQFDSHMDTLFEKWQLYDMLDKYDRIVFMDDDVLLSPKYPDIFAVVPETHIGCLLEDKGSRKPERRQRIARIKAAMDDSRLKNWHSGYTNSGVLVFSKRHQKVLEFDPKAIVPGTVSVEQNTINYIFRRSGFPICDIGPAYNFLSMFSEAPFKKSRRVDAHAIHYAGGGKFPDTNWSRIPLKKWNSGEAYRHKERVLEKDHKAWWGNVSFQKARQEGTMRAKGD